MFDLTKRMNVLFAEFSKIESSVANRLSITLAPLEKTRKGKIFKLYNKFYLLIGNSRKISKSQKFNSSA